MQATIRAAGAAILVLLCSTTGFATQGGGKVEFSCFEYLDDWEEVYYSEWSDLYAFSEFERLEGKRLSGEELGEVLDRWEAECSRVRELIAERSEAMGGELYFRMERRLAKHAYFGAVRYSLHDEHPPFVFYVVKPRGSDVHYTARIVEAYSQVLEPALALFEERIAAPQQLERRAGGGLYPVLLLPSEEDYANYFLAAYPGHPHDARPRYDLKLQATVLYEPALDAELSLEERRLAALPVFFGTLLQAYYSGGEKAPLDHWVLQGAAAYLTRLCCSEAEPFPPDPLTLRALLQAFQQPWTRWAHLRPVTEMVALRSRDEIVAFLRSKARREKLEPPDYMEALASYARQSALLFHFMHDGREAEYRALLFELLRAEMQGQGGSAGFRRVFADVKLPALDWQFRRWVLDRHQEAWPRIAIPEQELLAYGGAGAGPTSGAAPTLSSRELFDMEAPPARMYFAMSLLKARRGEIAVALDELEEQLPGVSDPELADRIELEKQRIEEWVALRDAFLAYLLDSGRRLAFEHDGRGHSAKLTAIEDGHVVLAKNRAKVDRLAVEGLGLLPLVEQMKRGTDDLAPRRVRAFAHLLGGDDGWEVLLDEDDADEAALRADAEEVYPELMRLGEAGSLMLELVSAPAPTGSADAYDRIDAVRRVSSEYGDLAWIGRQKAVLRRAAAEAYELLFEEKGPAAALHCSIEKTGERLIRMNYEFDDPAELDDFGQYPTLAKIHGIFPVLVSEETDSFTIEEGTLRAIGKAHVRHKFLLLAPITVRYDFKFDRAGDARGDHWMINGGICADGQNNYAWTINRQDLEVWRGSIRGQAVTENRSLMSPHKVYEMEVSLKGKRFSSSCDGVFEKELPCHALEPASAFLWVHTDNRVHIERLVIEGSYDAATLKKLKTSWIAEQLAQL